MTQDEIIEMARQAGAKTPRLIWPPTFTKSIDFTPEGLEAFSKLIEQSAAAKEREECAKVVDALEADCIKRDVDDPPLKEVAAAIRARGQA